VKSQNAVSRFLESIADKSEFDQRPQKSGTRFSPEDQGQLSAAFSAENIAKSEHRGRRNENRE
jgi:hypothetical protein